MFSETETTKVDHLANYFFHQHKAKGQYLYNQFHGQAKVVSSCVVPNETKLCTRSDARRVVITHPK